jgi:hypothetical protein
LSEKSKCDKCDIACDATNPILITHAISHRLSRSHLLLGIHRIGDLNDAARTALAPLLGDDGTAVNLDGDVDDVTWPVSVTTINKRTGMPLLATPRWWDGGTIVARQGRPTLSIAVKGGVTLARRRRRRWEVLATTTSKRSVGSGGQGGDNDDDVDPRGDDYNDTTISLVMATATNVRQTDI